MPADAGGRLLNRPSRIWTIGARASSRWSRRKSAGYNSAIRRDFLSGFEARAQTSGSAATAGCCNWLSAPMPQSVSPSGTGAQPELGKAARRIWSTSPAKRGQLARARRRHRTEILQRALPIVAILAIKRQVPGARRSTQRITLRFLTDTRATEGSPLLRLLHRLRKHTVISRREAPAPQVMDLTAVGDDITFDGYVFIDRAEIVHLLGPPEPAS